MPGTERNSTTIWMALRRVHSMFCKPMDDCFVLKSVITIRHSFSTQGPPDIASKTGKSRGSTHDDFPLQGVSIRTDRPSCEQLNSSE